MSKEGKIVFCTGGGCTAKLGAGALSRILEKLPRGARDPSLLVGYDSGMMRLYTALPMMWRWYRQWIFSRRWWMTPIPSARLQRPTP